MDILINITFPIFAIIAVGYLAGHWKILGQESGVALNRFVYLFALPSALFVFTARAQVADILNWPFIGTFVLGTVLTLLIALGANRASIVPLRCPRFRIAPTIPLQLR